MLDRKGLKRNSDLNGNEEEKKTDVSGWKEIHWLP